MNHETHNPVNPQATPQNNNNSTKDTRLANVGRNQRAFGFFFSALTVIFLGWAIHSAEDDSISGGIGAILMVILAVASAVVALFLILGAQKTKAQFLKQMQDAEENAVKQSEVDAKQAKLEQLLEKAVGSESTTADSVCPKCGTKFSSKTKFCPECGEPARKCCAKCGAEMFSATKFCPECGSKQP